MGKTAKFIMLLVFVALIIAGVYYRNEIDTWIKFADKQDTTQKSEETEKTSTLTIDYTKLIK